MTASTRARLVMDLGPQWRTLEPGAWRAHATPTDRGGAAQVFHQISTHPGSEPELAATVFQPVFDDVGAPSAILMASLVAYSFYTADLPSDFAQSLAVPALRTVEYASGVSADVLELTLPVYSADGSMVVLLAFASPNLTVRDQLESAFRTIAAAARIE